VTAATDIAGYVLGTEEGDLRWYMGCLFDWKAVAEQTGGRFSIVATTIRRGVEPPLHVHSREDEAFYVLEGEIAFQVGDDIRTADPGSFVFAPRGIPHTFSLKTDVARTLILLAPAGLEEAFFEFSEPARERSLQPEPVPEPNLERVEARDRDFGVTYVGPPLAEFRAE
jgi:quercetin dioxygenase-like cupin family protein